MPSRRASVWWLLVLIAMLFGATVSASAEVMGEGAKDLNPGASPVDVESAAKKVATPELAEVIAEKTEEELKEVGVKVNLPDDKELNPGDKVTMQFIDGEVVNETVPIEVDVVTEEVGGRTGDTHDDQDTRTRSPPRQ